MSTDLINQLDSFAVVIVISVTLYYFVRKWGKQKFIETYSGLLGRTWIFAAAGILYVFLLLSLFMPFNNSDGNPVGFLNWILGFHYYDAMLFYPLSLLGIYFSITKKIFYLSINTAVSTLYLIFFLVVKAFPRLPDNNPGGGPVLLSLVMICFVASFIILGLRTGTAVITSPKSGSASSDNGGPIN